MRLHGEVERSWPRIYARPLELRAGQSLTADGLIERLNDLGYAGRPQVTEAGQFAVGDNAIELSIRGGKQEGTLIRVVFGPAGARPGTPATASIRRIRARRRRHLDRPRHARTAAAQRARRRRPREAAQGAAGADSQAGARRRARHRGPPVLRPSRRRPDRVGGGAPDQSARREGVPGRRQHADAAAGQEPAADAREDDDAQAQGAVHGRHRRAAAVEGSDPRAVPERGLPRQPRLVRGARPARGGAALLRQGRPEPVTGRSSHPGRHDPVAAGAVALPLARALRRASQRGAERDGGRPASSIPPRPRRRARNRCSRRPARSSPRRPTSSTSSSRS